MALVEMDNEFKIDVPVGTGAVKIQGIVVVHTSDFDTYTHFITKIYVLLVTLEEYTGSPCWFERGVCIDHANPGYATSGYSRCFSSRLLNPLANNSGWKNQDDQRNFKHTI